MKNFSLYFYKDDSNPLCFGIKPPVESMVLEYKEMNIKFSLNDDLGWQEKQDFQKILRKTELWFDCIFNGSLLIKDELTLDNYNQRIDLLYLNSKGELLVCEIKIGGSEKDTVGQLLRYIAEISEYPIDISHLRKIYVKRRGSYHSQTDHVDDRCDIISGSEFDNYVENNGICGVAVNPKIGIIMDQNIDMRSVIPIKLLNKEMGTDYNVYTYTAFTNSDGKKQEFSKFRIDFVNLK